MVEIAAGDFTAHVLLEPIEGRCPPGTVGLLVELVAAGFVGVNREVYVRREMLAEFGRGLVAIAHGQSAEARLESLAPGQFELLIRAEAGVVTAMGTLRKVAPVGGRPFTHVLTTAFEPDAEGLEEALEALERLRSGGASR